MISTTSLISSRAVARPTTERQVPTHTAHEISVKVWGHHELTPEQQAAAAALLGQYLATHLASVGVEAQAHYVGALPC